MAIFYFHQWNNEEVYKLQVRSPAHYKILLTKAYELFKCRVTHQAAIYENLLKHVP
jgi:predicted RecB family nuclease